MQAEPTTMEEAVEAATRKEERAQVSRNDSTPGRAAACTAHPQYSAAVGSTIAHSIAHSSLS